MSDDEEFEDDVEIPLLFEQSYLDRFHHLCGFPKNTRILCKYDFIKWWELEPNNTTRNVRTSLLKERKNRIASEKNLLRQSELKAGRALGSLCKNIEKGYSDYTLLNVFAGFNDEYDFAVVVDTRPVGNSLKKKKNKIYGFIISQYNEFNCKPNVFALNLVCINHKSLENNFTKNPAFGRKLVALYMCSVLRMKDKNIKKECVLELGGGVSNVSAFLAYIRLGFRADIDMFQDKCISDVESLPMSIDLTNLARGVSKSLSRSNRTQSTSSETSIINAAIGSHIIQFPREPHNWKNIIHMTDRNVQTDKLKAIQTEYYDILRAHVVANPTSFSLSVRKHFGVPSR